MSHNSPVLSIRSLSVGFRSSHGVVPALNGVDLDVAPGETLGIVGESGSGKSLTALSILRLLPPGAAVTGGSVVVEGSDVLSLDDRAMRPYRGKISGLVFQDANAALDPLFTIGSHLLEAIQTHNPETRKSVAKSQAIDLLEMVGIPEPHLRFRQYPHQLSGGMKQRCMIAIAMANRPRLLIADEPTTALDVTLQAEILGLLNHMKQELGAALVLITHDLGVVAEMSDRIAVMYGGEIVESGPSREVLRRPSHPYTSALLRSLPSMTSPGSRLPAIAGNPPLTHDLPSGCAFHPRCDIGQDREICATVKPRAEQVTEQRCSACHFKEEVTAILLRRPPTGPPTTSPTSSTQELLTVDAVTKSFASDTRGLRRSKQMVKAVDGVSLKLNVGETLAIVGESGSGKTTVGRLVMRMLQPDRGSISFAGVDLASLQRDELHNLRRNIQMVFQDPYSSLNPRKNAREIVAEPLRFHKHLDRDGWRRAEHLLERVGIPSAQHSRYPAEFSGGQRQRIGIARALVLQPRLVVLDEPVSALDVSVQAQVLNLISDLKEEHGLSYILISHDLSVVSHVADRIVVMFHGRVVESGTRNDIFESPQHPYTQTLLDAIPTVDAKLDRESALTGQGGRRVSELLPSEGCRFAVRCSNVQPACRFSAPELEESGADHAVACYNPVSPIPYHLGIRAISVGGQC